MSEEQTILDDRSICATVSEEDMINEILAFCDHGVDDRDLLPLEEYKADPQRLIGHQPGIARAQLANRHARQTAHMAAGLAQFLSRRYAPGVLDDGDLDKVEAALARVISAMIGIQKYELGEFYLFRHPDLRPGFEELAGAVIEGAADMYPEAWAYFQTEAGQKVCKTEAEWQELSTRIYYTLADGTGIGFNGVGGVPFYSPNMNTGALRMPDIRGMYREAAGFDSFNVGGVWPDRIRNITADWGNTHPTAANAETHGAAYWFAHNLNSVVGLAASAYANGGMAFNAGRVVPVGGSTSPRHFGVLACAYLGQPVQSADRQAPRNGEGQPPHRLEQHGMLVNLDRKNLIRLHLLRSSAYRMGGKPIERLLRHPPVQR